MLKIEFFHDVICSYCFPMSYVVRKLKEKHPEIEIVHRSYALVWEEEDYVRAFGSREAAKEKIISHWEHANQIDVLHRFNAEGMAKTDFLFPLSRKPLLAVKAAEMIAGGDAGWDLFDALQYKLFAESENIEDDAVLEDLVKQQGLDLALWKKTFLSEACEKEVKEDFALAEKYALRSVPSLIVNEERLIFGALSLERLEKALFEQPGPSLKPLGK